MRAPTLTAIEPLERPISRSALGRAAQILAAAASLGLLAWCVWLAWGRLQHADAGAILTRAPTATAALVGLTAMSVLLSGLMFHAALAGARTIPVWRVVGVNAIASLAAFLPLKLGAFIRAAVHHRRDGLPIRLIVAWFATVGGVSALALAPFAGMSLLRGAADGLWWIAGAAAVALLTLAAPVVARFAHHRPALRALTLGSAELAASPRRVAGPVLFRLLDGASVAARFVVAGHLVGSPLSWSTAIALAPVFVLVGSASPAGVLGAREGALTGMALLPGTAGAAPGEIALVALTVTAGEALTHIVLGSIAAFALRLDRVLLAGPRRADR